MPTSAPSTSGVASRSASACSTVAAILHEADDLSVLEDRLAARRDPALGAAIHSDDAILDVAHAIAFGIDALTERRLDAIAIFRMDPGEKDAEIDGRVGREAPHGLEARVPLDRLRQRV